MQAKVAGIPRKIVGFHQDDFFDWVADLECGHRQHVRHSPPWTTRHWVTTPQGRLDHIGMELPCSLCATVARIPDQQLPRIVGMQKIRVLLAEDHPGVREAIRIQLNLYFEVVGCVDNGESLVESAMQLRPDVIVCDIEMPKLNGILAANRLRELNCATKIIFLTVHTDPELVRIALKTGALGCVSKTSIATDLMLAVRAAAQGKTFGPRGTPGVDV